MKANKEVIRVTATWNGRGEFYTGIRAGDRVEISTSKKPLSNWRNDWMVSIQKLDSGNAWLSVSTSQYDLLSDVTEEYADEQS